MFGNGATAIALGDLDRDGSPDVVIGSFDQHVYGIRGDGQVLWDAGVASNISKLAFGDLDGDGRDEIAAATMLVNSINPRSHGSNPVAILSRPGFHAPTELNTGWLTFGRTGKEASLPFCHPARVNADRLLDVICHFDTQSAGFVVGDTRGVLKGETLDGVPIRGSDAVRIVPYHERLSQP